MLLMSDKYECTQESSESMKLHILGVWQMPMQFIRQLANAHQYILDMCLSEL